MPELAGFGIVVSDQLELLYVFLTLLGSLAVMVALGAWWQR